MKRDWKLRAAIPVAVALIRILSATWRLNRINPSEVDALRDRGPVVFAFWHGHMLPLIHAHHNQNITVLVSEHADGELIARTAAAFGFPSVRGSTSRGAVRSLLALVKVVAEGGDIGVTPDGPRGPARSYAPGVLIAAQRANAPVVSIAAHASRAWRLRTWDSFVVPKPFATISVAYAITEPPARDEPIDAACGRFKQILNDTCALAGER